MEEYFYGIKGYVRLVKSTGFGFISPTAALKEGEKRSDIYFHFSNVINENFDWLSVKTGQKVTIESVGKNHKGYFAIGVRFVRPVKES